MWPAGTVAAVGAPVIVFCPSVTVTLITEAFAVRSRMLNIGETVQVEAPVIIRFNRRNVTGASKIISVEACMGP